MRYASVYKHVNALDTALYVLKASKRHRTYVVLAILHNCHNGIVYETREFLIHETEIWKWKKI